MRILCSKILLFITLLGHSSVISGQSLNTLLSQPQIYIQDGHLYISPAADRNLVLVANGTGKIHFNTVELNSLVDSIQTSRRDLNSFKRIFGVPSNSSSGLSNRIGHLEQSFRRLDQIDALDSRLTSVERTIAYNLTSGEVGQNDRRMRSRLRRLRGRVEAVENRVRNLGSTEDNPCASNPCQHGGTCIPTMFGPFCYCAQGWEGNMCQTDQNECAMFQGSDLGCQNGGTCVNTPGSYQCHCRNGFVGIHCAKRSGDCTSGPSWELCGHGICVDQKTGSRPFTCICEQGWKTNGVDVACNVDVDECNGPHASCSRNPRVMCINTPGSFHCGPCPAGYTGNGYYCDDINECLLNNGGCSTNPMVQCINTVGSRTCGDCPPGYIGNGITCQYVGMCQMNNGGCHPLARCVQNPNIGQSFVQCLCPAGYTGTGMGLHGCFPYSTGQVTPGTGGTAVVPASNACASNPCMHGTCIPNGNSFVCSCFPGFMGPTCNVRIDPCASNPCSNGGTCVPTISGFMCRCPNDFTGELCEIQEQSCGGTLTAVEGVLTYPHSGSESYSHNENCVWTIQTTEGMALTLNFTNFHLEGSNRCIVDYLQINDGATADSPMVGRFCGDNLPNGGIINTTHNVVRLKFVSDGSVAGLGFTLSWNTTVPYCGGTITNQTHGAISSPGYPGQYPHNRDCVWTLSVGLGKRIQLVFASMRLEVHRNCSFDYLQILDGLEENAHQLAIFCNTTLPPPLISTGPHLTFRFHSDMSDADTGFHVTFAEIPGIPGCGGTVTAPSGVISSPHHPEPYAHALDCEWLIRLPPLETISIEFLAFQIERAHNCRYDFVEVREGNGPDGNLVGRYCGGVAPPPYRSVTNNLFIRFHSDESVAYGGFRMKYEAACGGIFTTENILRSPYYPGSYPKNRDCVYLISQPVGKAIRLDFIDFDIENPTGNSCLFDFLEIRDGDNENSTLIGHYCGASAPDTIISTMNYLWIRFKTDGSVQNKGFMANFSTIDVGCGGIHKGERLGVIQSPRHPEVYPHGVSCKWIIRGEPGDVIRVTWASFNLEASARCLYDYVEVFDNSTTFPVGHTMGRFCGSTLPPIMTSSDNTITIVFKSDHSVAHDGFMASYAVLNGSKVCGGNYLTQYGVLKSPGYPNRYPPRRTCAWTIRVPAGRQIRLNVTDFEMERGTSRGCIYDYLEIRNGGLETSPLIGKFCGSNLPPTIIPSFANALYLKFSTDVSMAFKGFNIEWDGASTGCGGTITGTPQGGITSPNYPMHYGIRTECTWRITVNVGSIIQLTFVDLDIQDSPTCRGERVEVRDGANRNSKLIGKYCRSDSVLMLNSTSNAVTIKYYSTFGGRGRGFDLRFVTVCNRVIEGFGSVIESPNFPRPYPHNRNCTWEIRAPLGNTVNISFSHFNIEGPVANNCTYDFVRVSEKSRFAVPQGNAPQVLGTYCGRNTPTLISSKNDTVLVNFVSDATLAFNGFRLEWVLSGCGGRMVGNWGRLSSPNYPRPYPSSVTCIWLITTELGTRVNLNVWDLDIEQSSTCSYDHLRIYAGEDDSSALVAEVCHKTSNRLQYQSHGNNMYVVFHSDITITGKGFMATYSHIPGGCGARLTAPQGSIYSPNYPQNYDKDDDCGWLLTVDQNHVVQLEFLDFDVESHSNCSYDHVALYDGASEAAPLLLMHCGNASPQPAMIKATGNRMFVKFKTDGTAEARGFKANFTTGCGARLTNRYGQISTLETTRSVTSNNNCTWIITGNSEDHVTLTFTFMDIHVYQGNGSCSTAFVEILDGEDEDAPSIGRFCADTIPPALTSRSNSFVVRFLKGNSIGQGFRATYEVSSSACGGNLASMRGSFTSPNYPVGYPLNAECVWNVRASPGNRVLLSFRQMSIEASDYCNNDFVEIHEESSSGRLLGHYCGNEIPANVTAGNNLWVLFRSDGEGQGSGFWADYELQHGNELNGTTGQIASPLWPTSGVYAGDFYWRITVTEGMTVQIEFRDFQIGATTTCSPVNEFTINDGYDSTAPVLLQACGTTLPDPVTSSGNVMYISFVKRYSYGQALFNLVWNEVPPTTQVATTTSNITGCGGNVTIRAGNTTTLLSPNFPTGYYPNMRCEWTIFTDQTHRISLKIENFDMEGSPTCAYDKVEVYQGSTGDDYTLNQTICRRDIVGNEYVSMGRTVKIVMMTDASVQKAGFNITVGTKCGGVIVNNNGELGRITSTNYGAGNYQHEICEWFIHVRPGRTVRVTFNDMNIYAPPSGGGCSTDSLVLRNGGHATSPVLGQGRYCGNTRPADLETSGNQLYVKFTAFTSGGRGFSLTFQEVSVACGGQIHLTDEISTYEFTTPQYPGVAPPFTECEWVFSVPSYEAVQIDFLLRFDITLSQECANAGVEIRDGGTRLSPMINKYCRDMPGTQKSTGNHLYLRYYNSIMEPGTGFKARASIARCGGTMLGWSGYITSPGYPSPYDVNLNCVWTIKGPEGSYISLRFNDVDLNSGFNCTQDKIIVSERNVSGITSPREWNICDTSSTIETSMNQVHVIFRTDGNQDGNKKGFRLYYRASVQRCGGYLWAPSGFIQSPGYPRPYTHYRWCSWTINAPPGRRIRIEFQDFDLEQRIITATSQYCVDYVSVTQNFEAYSYRSRSGLYGDERLCGSTLPPPVETTSSKVVILFRSDGSVAHRGFKLKYTTDLPIICGGEIPAEETFGSIGSPNVTTGTPNTTTSTTCQWVKAGEANNVTTIVSVNRLYIPQPGQSETASSLACTGSGGYLRVSSMGYWAEPWKKFCGSVSNQKLYLAGDSFRADYMAMNTSANFNVSYQVSPCGGRLDGPDNITSPSFPSSYPTNTECIWLLEFNWNSQIKLTFTDLDLDDSQDSDGACNRDYVVIRNGQYSTSPLLGKYCGTNLPQEIRSMSRYLFIEFHSDENSNGNRRGFRIEAEAIERGCGGTVHAKSGSLASPRQQQSSTSNRPPVPASARYPHNTECEWIVESVSGYVLQFVFVNRFDLEVSPNCSNDYVEIFTSSDGTWSSAGKFCGKQLPPSFNTTSMKAKVIFHSNEAVNGDGFRLNWNSACGGLYKGRSGVIRSAYFDKYEHSWGVSSFNYWAGLRRENLYKVQKCDYVIQGSSPTDYIVGEFMDPFHVAPHEAYGLESLADPALRCPIVNVSIWEGNDTTRSWGSSARRVGGIYCGEDLPPAFIATGAAVISYNYLAMLENYGFRLNYTIYQCGGLITTPTRIASPGHPYTSAPNMNCTWVIKAPRNKVVRVKLERLELEYHQDCNFDGVHLYDGSLVQDSKKLASFCGNLTDDLHRINSISDSMTVTFITDYSIQLAGFAAAIDFTLGPQQNCGGKVNLTSGSTRSIGSPDADNDGNYDSNLECNWLIIGADFQQIELIFNSFNVEGPRGGDDGQDSCPYDYVEIRDGPGPYSDVLGKFCRNRLPPRISSATNFMWITFVSDGPYNYPGFRATVSSRQSPCGSSFILNATQTPQYLTSPNYPQNYGNNVKCRYVVTGSSRWDEVDIRFVDVQIEPSAECSKDSLRIRDVSTSYTSREGISGPVLFNGARNRDWRFASVNIDTASIMQDVSYCGSLHPLPPDFISIGRSAEIIFETDSSNVAKGFKLMYQAAGCNRTYGSVQGRIYSPEWPTFSPPYSSCVFTINAPNGSVISMYFNEFLLPDSISCISGALEVRENNGNGRVLARYCGSAVPNPIFSTTSTVWVQYFTKGTPSRGYDITYTTTSNGVGCGGDIFHTGGSLTSPYYPSNYSGDADCRWRIRVPAALKLQFDFTTFAVEGNCDQNFVEVSSMNSHALNEDPLLVARYCPGDTPSRYIGTTDMALIRYRTTPNNTGNGWRIVFRGVLPTQLPA